MIMGKDTDLTFVWYKSIDTLQKEANQQKVIAKEDGCSQSAVFKHITEKLSGKGNKRAHTKVWIVMQTPSKSLIF